MNVPPEVKSAVESQKYYWGPGFDHTKVGGPKAERMRREVLLLCDAVPALTARLAAAEAVRDSLVKRAAAGEQRAEEEIIRRLAAETRAVAAEKEPTPEQIEAAAKDVYDVLWPGTVIPWGTVQFSRQKCIEIATAAIAAYRRSLGITTKGE